MKSELGKQEQGDEATDRLLTKLLYLKSYETPSEERMLRNRRNIMREIREVDRRRWSWDQLLEMKLPWLFAEPRYGLAMLFVVFAGLQFWSHQVQQKDRGSNGLYTAADAGPRAVYNTAAVAAGPTNQVVYTEVPRNFQVFPGAGGDSSIQFVSEEFK